MSDTLRLVMPQWQGGNNPSYSLGAKLLAWLAPAAGDTPQIEVPVAAYDGRALPEKNGVAGQEVLLGQLRAAAKIIEAHRPKRLVVFGGDCLVSQAPFAYLNETYGGKLGVLWLDAHPDVSTPQMHRHEHAMVLGNLLGQGDPAFSAEVRVPLQPARVMYGGLREGSPEEMEILRRLKLRTAGPETLAAGSGPVLQWIAEKEIEHLAIHFDLDVLDPARFRSLLFAEPGGQEIDAPCGKMSLPQVQALVGEVAKHTEIVGLSIAEYLPWDALHLQGFLSSLPLFTAD
ncbi:arginase family protein [Ruminococcaceae bacterium OttesenSCG-928-I18]|nr:arginase family protein [Ruminococcaceae bacterium OttesenSCG-928-I18]